jgi:hypothetical protein
MGQNEKAKKVYQIQKAETKLWCQRICKYINKPRGEAGGLTHLIIQTTKGEEIIDDNDEMEKTLINRNIKHFSQAKQTPCATGELKQLLGENGISEVSEKALKGIKMKENMTEISKDILQQLKQVRAELSDSIPLADMINGFLKWREKTVTSPSGKHLGIYRTLIKTHNNQYTKPTINLSEMKEQEKINKEKAAIALDIQNKLINMAIKHCHTYNRWKVIHNFFIEKIPGRPLINKLRVIHIYEADWNFICKYFVSHQLHSKACHERTVRTEQTGGRPGKSASHAAIVAVLTNEIICLQKPNCVTIYNDAAACFDRIIENISNVTLMREGLSPKIAKLHSQTLTSAKYFIKTKKGIAKRHNGHNQPEPFYGTGQGAADSMPRWSILSDLLIRLYTEKAKTNNLYSPISKELISAIIKAYVDDTYSTFTGSTLREVKLFLIHNATLWERLLYQIGGKLEISKCKFVVYNWEYNDIGNRDLIKSKSIGKITINESEGNNRIEIEEIASTEPYKLLGIQISPSDNQKGNIKLIEEKCNKMISLLKTTNLPVTASELCLSTIIIPTLKYGQGAMTIARIILQTTQKPLTNKILPSIGYNRHTPRAIVYASRQLGGIAVPDLYTEQGLSQIQFLIGAWRSNCDSSKLIKSLIETYIICSGTLINPFAKEFRCSYIKSSWINSIQNFLTTINGTITINEINITKKVRVNDDGIMYRAIRLVGNITKLQAINNCRIFLQITTIAEITNIDGTHILADAINGSVNEDGQLNIHEHSKSLIHWPTMKRPPEKAWRIWKKIIKTLMHNNTNHLKKPMGRWLQGSIQHRIWFSQVTKKILLDLIPIKLTQVQQNNLLNQNIIDNLLSKQKNSVNI